MEKLSQLLGVKVQVAPEAALMIMMMKMVRIIIIRSINPQQMMTISTQITVHQVRGSPNPKQMVKMFTIH